MFEAEGPRFRTNRTLKKKAIVGFTGKKSHSGCNFRKDDFKILHVEDMSCAEIVTYATTKPGWPGIRIIQHWETNR